MSALRRTEKVSRFSENAGMGNGAFGIRLADVQAAQHFLHRPSSCECCVGVSAVA
jgi:hypothetical protein